jgi:transcriptional regulator with XRE-family HTH domain
MTGRVRPRAGPEDTRGAAHGATVAARLATVEDRESEPRPSGEGVLQEAIGRQIREFRTALGMTVAELGRQSDLSPGAISKIERGLTPPSLASLSAIAGALAVPVTALFRKHEEQRDASYVEAGKGLVIERRGTRVGHRYELLGHTISGRVAIEPYLVTLSEESEVFPLFQHAGVEFLYLLEGEVVYRAAGATYHLRPGDSLLFDGDAAHGPEQLVRLPIRMLAIISRAADER